MRLVTRGRSSKRPSVDAAVKSSSQLAVARACHNAATLSVKCSGMGPTFRPKTSLTWSVAITVAMPVVKPVVTGWGMNCIRRPRRATPIATKSTPAMKPAVSRPLRPYWVTMGARITTNAAVGPVT